MKFKSFYNNSISTVKRNTAKVMGLIHVAYNIWKDDKGNHFIWNNDKSHFVKHNGNIET